VDLHGHRQLGDRRRALPQIRLCAATKPGEGVAPKRRHCGFPATPAVAGSKPARAHAPWDVCDLNIFAVQHWVGHSATVSEGDDASDGESSLRTLSVSLPGNAEARAVRLPIALARATLKHFAQDGEAIEGTGKTAVRSGLDDGFDHLLPG
jgi:hypothetical protein